MTLRAGDRDPDVRIWQQKLIEGGFLPPGSDDGVFGPKTEAATRAFQTSHGLHVDGVVGPETWGNMMGDPKYPNNSTGALTAGGGGGGNANTAAIKEKYPQLAYLIDDPEIGPILAQAEREGWSGDKFQSTIMGTNWWRSNEDSARKYYNLQHTDPATFQRKIWDMSDIVYDIGSKLGYDHTILTPEYVSYFAHKAVKQGSTPDQLRAIMVGEITPLAGTTETSPVLAQIREVIQAYDYQIDNSSLHYWLRGIGSGRQTIDNFRQSVIQQMKIIYPHLANNFDEGMTLDQYTRPYRTQIADMLELDPNQVDFGDPKWRHVIDYVDPKDGTHRSMSNQELGKYLRSQDRYWGTRQGKDAAGEMVEGILSDFGAVRR